MSTQHRYATCLLIAIDSNKMVVSGGYKSDAVCEEEKSHVRRLAPRQAKDVYEKDENYRWFLLAFMVLHNIISGMIFTGTSVLYAQYSFHFEASKAEIGWSFSIHMALIFLLGIFLSAPIKVFGGRPVAFCGGVFLVVGYLITSQVNDVYYLYITQGLITGIGHSMIENTAYLMIQFHFTTHRALGTGISCLGFNIGNFIGPLLMQYLIDHYGWRGALVLFSGVLLQILPLSLTFRQPHKRPKFGNLQDKEHIERTERNESTTKVLASLWKDIGDFSLLKRPSFVLFCIGGGCLYRFVHVGFAQHFTSKTLHNGIDKTTAAWLLSEFFAIASLTRLSVAFIANIKTVRPQIIFIVGVGLAVLANLLMACLAGIYGPASSAVFFGLSVGSANTVFPVVLVDLNGVDQVGRSLALFWFCTGIGVLVGTPSMGFAFDITGNYNVPYYMNLILSAVATILCIAMYVSDRRIKKSTRLAVISQCTIDDMQATDCLKNNTEDLCLT